MQSLIPSPVLGELYSGSSLASHLFDAVGLVVILGAVALIIFKFFLGQSKNVGAGVGALLAVGVLAYLAQNPQSVLDMGKTVLGGSASAEASASQLNQKGSSRSSGVTALPVARVQHRARVEYLFPAGRPGVRGNVLFLYGAGERISPTERDRPRHKEQK